MQLHTCSHQSGPSGPTYDGSQHGGQIGCDAGGVKRQNFESVKQPADEDDDAAAILSYVTDDKQTDDDARAKTTAIFATL